MTSHPRKRTATGRLGAPSDKRDDGKGDNPAGGSPSQSAGRSRALPADRGGAEETGLHPRAGKQPQQQSGGACECANPAPCVRAFIRGSHFQPQICGLKCTMEQRRSVTPAPGWHPVGSRLCADPSKGISEDTQPVEAARCLLTTQGPRSQPGHQGGAVL